MPRARRHVGPRSKVGYHWYSSTGCRGLVVPTVMDGAQNRRPSGGDLARAVGAATCGGVDGHAALRADPRGGRRRFSDEHSRDAPRDEADDEEIEEGREHETDAEMERAQA